MGAEAQDAGYVKGLPNRPAEIPLYGSVTNADIADRGSNNGNLCSPCKFVEFYDEVIMNNSPQRHKHQRRYSGQLREFSN